MIPVLTNNRDLLESVQAQIRFFQQIPEAYVVLCDNASTYPPLLEWLADLQNKGEQIGDETYLTNPSGHLDRPDQLFMFKYNGGPRAAMNVLAQLDMDFTYYFTSDADLDYTDVPLDLFDYLKAGLNLSGRPGCGVSIRINDVPASKMGEYAKYIETGNWEREYLINTSLPGASDLRFWDAPCDTAGILRTVDPWWQGSYDGIRSAKHAIRHLPFYHVSADWICNACGYPAGVPNRVCLSCVTAVVTPPDFKWFLDHADPAGTTYTSRILDSRRPL